MKLLVDGAFYQLAQSGIGRVWTSLLGQLATRPGLEIVMLDRGRAPAIDGVERVPFPSYTMTYTAADSLLLQEFCDRLQVDLFTSTYYTTPTRTPQVQLVYDMIPELLDFKLSDRVWKEKALALNYASHVACISARTRGDLLELYPRADPARVTVMHCGVDAEMFNGATARHLPIVQAKYGMTRPYYMLVGAREQHKNYKNGKLLFDAARIDQSADYDIVCVGGEQRIDPAWLLGLPPTMNVHLLRLPDEELATLYSGAVALIYPSLYAGFGLPVLEAMSTGCPVITTHCGALSEVAGSAAAIVTGLDPRELLQAMKRLRAPGAQAAAMSAGLAQARTFTWAAAAERFHALLLSAQRDATDPQARDFHRQWTALRTTQASVDIGID